MNSEKPLDVEAQGAKPGAVVQGQLQGFLDVTRETGYTVAGGQLIVSVPDSLEGGALYVLPLGTLLLYAAPDSARDIRPVARGAEPAITVFLDVVPESGYPSGAEVLIMRRNEPDVLGRITLPAGSMLFQVAREAADRMRLEARKQVQAMRAAEASKRLRTGRPD